MNAGLFIIDFAKKGNVVRLYFGSDSEYWGDDWDDTPYEHNAGEVYDEYIRGVIDVAFPSNYAVFEPCDDWRNEGNSRYSKLSMKKKKVPCIVACKLSGFHEWDDPDTFSAAVAQNDSIKLYFGDHYSKLETIEDMTILKEYTPEEFLENV